MKRSTSSKMPVLALGFAAAVSAPMAFAEPEFSAEMVQRGLDGASSTAKMFVGDQRMRTEMSHQGQRVVRITDQKRGVEWLLFPERNNYMEQRLKPPGSEAKVVEPTADNPCVGMPGLDCRKIGEERVSGRAAVKWEMLATHDGQALKGTQWIDKERGPAFLLRQEMPNGQKMERMQEGEETLGGRQTEKWKIVMYQPGGQTVSTTEWYDPELEVALKQEFPGGMVSELQDVRVGEQPDHLFAIPAGFERISMPQGMPGQSQQR